ncbi:MAG: prepilin-type N-terminal cleavage/methylation domain-containing protein [Candidatus Muiribacteriota bacterium]
MNIKKKGFTIVELMIVIGILGLLGVLLTWQVLSSRASKDAEISTVDFYNVRQAMQKVTYELENCISIQAVGNQNIEYRSGEDSEIYNLVYRDGKLIKSGTDNFEEKNVAEVDFFEVNLVQESGNVIEYDIGAGEVNMNSAVYIRTNN